MSTTRVVVAKVGDVVKITSEEGEDITADFPAIVEELKQLSHDVVLGCEILGGPGSGHWGHTGTPGDPGGSAGGGGLRAYRKRLNDEYGKWSSKKALSLGKSYESRYDRLKLGGDFSPEQVIANWFGDSSAEKVAREIQEGVEICHWDLFNRFRDQRFITLFHGTQDMDFRHVVQMFKATEEVSTSFSETREYAASRSQRGKPVIAANIGLNLIWKSHHTSPRLSGLGSKEYLVTAAKLTSARAIP